MALRFNGNSPTGPNPFSAQVGRVLGTATGITVQTTAKPLYARGGSRMAVHLTYGTAVGLPLGSAHPTSWAMPSVAGAIASRNRVGGDGDMAGTAQSGYNIEALVTGDGGISNAPLGLIVTIAASLIGSGTVSSAEANALASMVATITGSGDIDATAAGLADLGAALAGSGAVTANNTALMDIAATIRGYGDLTPEGLRDAVWNAMLANYQTTGSAGKTLELAGSGGVDYQALGEAVWAILLADANAPGSMGALVQTMMPADVAAAVIAAAQTTPIYADTRKMNGADVIGTGEVGDAWRGDGVPP
jgi:hypothetical protein